MSDYYYEIIGKTRHAELAEQARQDGLVKSLPHHPGPLARLWARIIRPTQPVIGARPVANPHTSVRRHAGTARHA